MYLFNKFVITSFTKLLRITLMVQNDILLKHLSSIYDPELAVNIVDLGMVKDVKHIEKDVHIKLALTIADCPMRNQIETEIERKLLLLKM